MFKVFFIFSMMIWLATANDAQGESFKSLQKKMEKKRLSKRYTSYQLYKNGHFFSALNYLKDYYKKAKKTNKKDPEMAKLMEVLLVKAGTESLGDLPDHMIKGINAPTVALILARRMYYKKDYKRALGYLAKIPSTHRLAPDAFIMRGMIAYEKKNDYASLSAYAQCSKITMSLKGGTKSAPLKRYYDILSQGCLINQARIYFKQKKFKKSLEFYSLIPKTSYHWPYIILEKAWNYYYLKDYNRVLGLLVTYKSPLLTSYFFPEAEMLKALAYYRLCLWDDALNVIKRYYSIYKSRSSKLHTMLTKHKDSHTFFFELVNTPIEKNEKKNMFIRNLVVMVKKKVKYNLDQFSYMNAKDEYYKLKKEPKGKLRSYGMIHVREDALYRKAKINHYTKTTFFNFLNDIYLFSQRLFTLKLEILSSQRHMMYAKKKFEKRKRGDLSEVSRQSDEYFFGFDGEFWADELGDYSFGLKSQCQQESSFERKGEE